MATLPRLRTLIVLAALVPPSAAFAAGTPVRSTITAVTVYADRAVVTREATLAAAEAGPEAVVFDRLPSGLVERSLQISGEGPAAVTILEVSASERFVPFVPDQRVKTLEGRIEEIQRKMAVIADQNAVLEDQGAALDRIEVAATPEPTKDTPHFSFADADKLLAFLAERRTKVAADQRNADEQAHQLNSELKSAQRRLERLRGDRSRRYKTVTVRLISAAAGKLKLRLSYAVEGARWLPEYTARVNSADSTVKLGYFGIVRQSTGEDWKDVKLTLSTARPSLGGAPPALRPWIVDVYRPKAQSSAVALGRGMQPLSFQELETLAGTRVRPITTIGGITDAASGGSVRAGFMQDLVSNAATSASFVVPVRTTVASDGSAQKVPISTLDLKGASEYTAVPKEIRAAFLTDRVVNASDVPLLAGEMSVFLDGTFVATSRLDTVMPGEKFNLALGADEAISADRKLVRRVTEDTGIISKTRRVSYEFVLTLDNHKKTAEMVVLKDQVPVSRNAKIVVTVLSPPASEVKPDADGILSWTVRLNPGERREVPLKFTVGAPVGMAVTGLD
ncbi:MAG: mucoidy inhibitor MuiA family protein [Opitutaceae bacterium]